MSSVFQFSANIVQDSIKMMLRNLSVFLCLIFFIGICRTAPQFFPGNFPGSSDFGNTAVSRDNF